MPVIQPIEDHLIPQGAVSGRANGQEFGAGVGQAYTQLGGAMSNLANTIGNELQKVKEDEGRIWAYDAATHAYNVAKKAFTDQVNSLDPSDPEFSKKVEQLVPEFEQQWKTNTDNLVAQAPTRATARVIKGRMTTNGQAMWAHAAAETARLTGAYVGHLEDQAVKGDIDSIAADYSNENTKRIMDAREKHINDLLTVSPELKMKWAATARHNYAVTQVGALFSNEPEAALALVNARGGRVTTSGAVKGAVPGGPPTLPAPGAAPAKMDFSTAIDAVFKREGGYSPKDSNGYPVNYGINQGANPDLDVAKLTREEAAKIYKTRYWDAIGGDSLPDSIKASALDSAVNVGVGWTKAALEKADGDLAKFNALRREHYRELAKDPDKAKYLSQWLARVEDAPAGGSASSNTLPQVETLSDSDIANAKPAIVGWQELTWPEKVAAVRQAESVLGGRLATERGAVKQELKDASASLLAGKQYPNLDSPRYSEANLTRLFGPVDGPRLARNLDYEKKTNAVLQNVATMPTAQLGALIKSMEPEGGPGFADTAPIYKHLVEAFQNRQILMDKDFMQYAMDKNLPGAAPVNFSDSGNFGKTIQARIALANAGETDFQADAHLMSKAEVAQFGDMLSRMNPQDQMAYIKSLRRATLNHDDWFTDTLKQIAPGNTMLAYAASVSMRSGTVNTEGGQMTSDQVGQRIIEGAHLIQGKALGDTDKVGRPMALDDKLIRDAFWAAVGPDAFASPDPTRSNKAAEDTYQAVKNFLAADVYYRGLDPTQASSDAKNVKNAITAVTGGTVKIQGSNLFIPWGMDENAFSKTFPLAVDAAITDAGLKGGPLDAPDGFKYFNVDEGRYGILNANRQPLLGSDGRPVIVDISRQFASPYSTGTNYGSYSRSKDPMAAHSLSGMMGRK